MVNVISDTLVRMPYVKKISLYYFIAGFLRAQHEFWYQHCHMNQCLIFQKSQVSISPEGRKWCVMVVILYITEARLAIIKSKVALDWDLRNTAIIIWKYRIKHFFFVILKISFPYFGLDFQKEYKKWKFRNFWKCIHFIDWNILGQKNWI